MTKEHVKRLVDYTRRNSNLVLHSVLNAIKELGNPMPNEIEKFLDKKATEEVQKQYELGKITKREIPCKVKEETIDIRTIHRKLDILVQKGWVVHKESRYSVSEKALSDIRIYADIFGSGLHNIACDSIFSGCLEREIKEFVECFGAQIVYTFLEAAFPVDDDSMTSTEKHEFTLTWVKNAIPIEQMFYRFIAHFLYLPKHDDVLMDSKTVRNLTHVFKKIYPEIHRKLLRDRHRFMFGSKSAYILTKNGQSHPWFIDYKEGDMKT